MTDITAERSVRDAKTPPSLGALLLLGARSAMARPISSFVVLPMIAAVAVGGCLVPKVNFAFLLIGLAPTVASLPAVALAIARGDQKPARQALAGFRHFERSLALLWVPYLIAIAAGIPLFVAFWAARHFIAQDNRTIVLGVAATLSLLIFVGAVHRVAFAPFAAFSIDRRQSFPAVLEHAAAPMRHYRGALLLRLAGLVVLASSGASISGFGALLTAPWALIAAAHLYLSVWPSTPPPPDPRHSSESTGHNNSRQSSSSIENR